ncbi:DUF3108 domain-containing protein [bacterium]|nr:DUF3108 domain-containing protein [bacterium]
MYKNYLTYFTLFLMAGLLTGCATGKTEFHVMQATPTPVNRVTVTATPIAQPPSRPPEPRNHLRQSEETYIVVAGDCLWNICEKFYGDPWHYQHLAKTNQITNPDRIEPGQVLILGTLPARHPVPLKITPKLKIVSVQSPKAVRMTTPVVTPEPVLFPLRPNAAFGPGERLHFSIEYFGISAGYATLSVNPGPEMNGRPTLHIVAEARTHPAFEWFFKVRDRIESFFDAQSLFSWRYEKHLREGKYSNDSHMIYDQVNRKVIKDKGRTIIDAPPLVQDVLSEFYFYRTLEQEIGDETTIPVLADDGKQYEVLVKVIRREKVRVPAGEFDCLVVEPYLKFEGVFKHQGKIHIWLTNDKRRVPVLIKSGIIIGTIDIVLRDAAVVDF